LADTGSTDKEGILIALAAISIMIDLRSGPYFSAFPTFLIGLIAMAIPVACPCGKQLKARDSMAGKRAKCPSCGRILDVPITEDVAAEEFLEGSSDESKAAAPPAPRPVPPR
jgi:hypothetical protein